MPRRPSSTTLPTTGSVDLQARSVATDAANKANLAQAGLAAHLADTGNPHPQYSNQTTPGYVISIIAGNGQQAPQGTTVAIVPVVEVRNVLTNEVVSGISVTFAVTAGGGAVTGGSASTNAFGRASPASWQVGSAAGTNTLTATVAGAVPVTFTAVATSPVSVPTNATPVTGNNQSVTVSTPLPTLLSARFTDQFGVPVVSAQVDWVAISGAPTANPPSVFTDSNGVATSTITSGPGAGTQSISARLASNTGVAAIFTITASVAPPVTPPTVITPGSWVPVPSWGEIGAPSNATASPLASATIQDWSTGVGVDVGTIQFGAVLATNVTFPDSALAADCVGWDVFGPISPGSLPVLGGIRFTGVLLDIKPGGRFPSGAKRGVVFMWADDLVGGKYGVPIGKRTVPPAHKVVWKNANGVVVDTTELHDGLPVNDPSLEGNPLRVWNNGPFGPYYGTTYPTVRADKANRHDATVGMCYTSNLGTLEVEASAANLNRIPRATSDVESVRRTYRFSFAVRGIEHNTQVGNGLGHPMMTPKWAYKGNEVDSLPNGSDPDVFFGQSSFWVTTRLSQWGYEPGQNAVSLTGRGGPGGVRSDRTTLPSDWMQGYLVSPSGARPHDGATYADMCNHWIWAHKNWPAYHVQNLANPKPVDVLTLPHNTPGLPSGTYHWFPANFYYNPGADPNGTDGGQSINAGIWAFDNRDQVNDNAWGGSFGALTWNFTDQTMPFGHWAPDSEHNHRTGLAWATLLKADPLWSYLHDYVATDAFTITGFLFGRERFWTIGNTITDPVGDTFLFRPFMATLCHAAMAWWTANSASVNSRAKIEAALRDLLVYRHDVIAQGVPVTATDPNHVGWNSLSRQKVVWVNNAQDGGYTGWVAQTNMATPYAIQFALYLRTATGFRTAMETGGTSTQNTKVSTFFTWLEEHLAGIATLFASRPSAGVDDQAGFPLRSSAQGAVQTTLGTIPTSLSAAIANMPANRTSWWLREDNTTLRDTGFSAHVMWKAVTAWLYWQYVAPAGSTRTTNLAACNTALDAYKAAVSGQTIDHNSVFLKFAWKQSIPALGG